MGRRLWWGALAGATAGLAMLACALGLAGLGWSECLQPYLALSVSAVPGVSHSVTAGLAVLGPGAALHETVAITLGLLGAWSLAPLARSLAGTISLIGGGLSMALLDAVVLAVRVPGRPLMADTVRALEYVVFGLVLATCTLVPGLSGAPFRRIALPWRLRGDRVAGPPVTLHRAECRPAAAGSRPLTLEVVVVPHCLSCARARSLAAMVATRYPTLDVRVVDLAQPGVVAPPGIVAVPAYVLNGRVMFTGNPSPDALATALSQAAARGDPSLMPSLQSPQLVRHL